MTKTMNITQLYNDNLRLIEEVHKRDSIIQVLLSRINSKENRNGRK